MCRGGGCFLFKVGRTHNNGTLTKNHQRPISDKGKVPKKEKEEKKANTNISLGS